MSRVLWSKDAVDDLASIDDFYVALDVDYADRVGRAAIRAARFLADHPGAGPIVTGEFRKWRIPGTRHLLVYRVRTEAVEILRVHHGRENWRPPAP